MGEQVNVYIRDKWRPAELVSVGRKWSFVMLDGRQRRVPKGAVKPWIATQSMAEMVAKESLQEQGWTMAKVDGFWKIKKDGKTVVVTPGAYEKEMKICFDALKGAGREQEDLRAFGKKYCKHLPNCFATSEGCICGLSQEAKRLGV